MTSQKRKERREIRHLLHPRTSGKFKPEHPATTGSWQPGQSGNPAGRKPGPTFTSLLREALGRKRRYRRKSGVEFESTEMELIVERAIKELRTNPIFDVKLLSVILDRIEGKVKEPVREEKPPYEIGELTDAELHIIAADAILSERRSERASEKE